MKKIVPFVLAFGILALAILILAFNIFTTVQAGHMGVGTLFGKVRPGTFSEGIQEGLLTRKRHRLQKKQ